jgi:hypothetical protein
MDSYDKYLKYKNKYINLKKQHGGIYTLLKSIPKGIAATTQIIGEKSYNEIKCVTNKKNSIEIIKQLNEHRINIISLFTIKGYGIAINAKLGSDDRIIIGQNHKGNYYLGKTFVPMHKKIYRLIIEIVNKVLYKNKKRLMTKSFTSYESYTDLKKIYNILVNEYPKTIESILNNHEQIIKSSYFMLNNIQCQCRNQEVPFFGTIECDPSTPNKQNYSSDKQNHSSNKQNHSSNKQNHSSNKQNHSSNEQNHSSNKQTLCQQDYCNREIYTDSNLRQTLLKIKKNINQKNIIDGTNIKFEQDQSYKDIINCKTTEIKFMTATECKSNMHNNS